MQDILETCSYCRERVLFTNDVCPNCHKARQARATTADEQELSRGPQPTKINMMHVVEKTDTGSRITWKFNTFCFDIAPEDTSVTRFGKTVECPTCGKCLQIEFTQGVFRISKSSLRLWLKALMITLRECVSPDSFQWIIVGGIFLGILPAGILIKIGFPGEMALAIGVLLFGATWFYCVSGSIRMGIKKATREHGVLVEISKNDAETVSRSVDNRVVLLKTAVLLNAEETHSFYLADGSDYFQDANDIAKIEFVTTGTYGGGHVLP